MAGKPKNITGKRFGKLLVTKSSFIKNETLYWECVCDCGKIVTVAGSSLRRTSRPTISCGCSQRSAAQKSNIANGRLLPIETLRINILHQRIKESAKNRKLLFDLTKKSIIDIVDLDCYYCGSSPKNEFILRRGGSSPITIIYQGIDRIDSELGYIIENIRPCCKLCNMAKGRMTEKAFISHLKNIIEYMDKKNVE